MDEDTDWSTVEVKTVTTERNVIRCAAVFACFLCLKRVLAGVTVADSWRASGANAEEATTTPPPLHPLHHHPPPLIVLFFYSNCQ